MTYGTEPYKLHRTDAIDTSVDAAYSADTSRLERIVHMAIFGFGANGCIADDLLAVLHQYPYSSITARFRALIDKGLIVRTGEKRKGRSGRGQSVMIDVRFADDLEDAAASIGLPTAGKQVAEAIRKGDG